MGYAQYIVLRTAKMTKYSVPEHETQSMAATAKTNVNQRIPINGEKLQDLIVPDGVQLSVTSMKFCALPWLTLVMVAQLKKSAEKPSRIRTEFSAQERNIQSSLKEKIIESPETDEVDSYLLLITAQYIAKNGKEKSNAQYTKMFQDASLRLHV